MTHDHIFSNYKLIIFAILEPKAYSSTIWILFKH